MQERRGDTEGKGDLVVKETPLNCKRDASDIFDIAKEGLYLLSKTPSSTVPPRASKAPFEKSTEVVPSQVGHSSAT